MFQLRGLNDALPPNAIMTPCSVAPVGSPCTPDGQAPNVPTTANIPPAFLKLQTMMSTGALAPGVIPSAGAQFPLVNTAMPGIAKPWYTTWWGLLLLAGGGYFGYKKFFAK